MAHESEETNCFICHEPLIDGACGALECGHVYHVPCVMQWFAMDKHECCQCKRPCKIENMVTLDFVLTDEPVTSDSDLDGQLQQYMDLTSEERAQLKQSMEEQLQKVDAQAEQLESELREARKAHVKARQRRTALKQERAQKRAAIADLQTRADKILEDTVSLQGSIPEDLDLFQTKLPFKALLPHDHEYQDMKRRLGDRPTPERIAELTRSLHEQMVEAVRHERKSHAFQGDKQQFVVFQDDLNQGDSSSSKSAHGRVGYFRNNKK